MDDLVNAVKDKVRQHKAMLYGGFLRENYYTLDRVLRIKVD